MIISRIYETQNLLSLYLVSFLVELRTYQYAVYIYIYTYREHPVDIQGAVYIYINIYTYTQSADKSIARPTSRCILFDG